MQDLIYYKGYYIQRQLVAYNFDDDSDRLGYFTTLPDEAVPHPARLRGFRTEALAKKYITLYVKSRGC